jgi:23S rRNA-/tRNA-specific pseudouridylate synthase
LPKILIAVQKQPKVSCCYSHVKGKFNHPATVRSKEIVILYELDHLLIIHKPHGIAHHNNPGENDKPDSYGIVNLLQQQ